MTATLTATWVLSKEVKLTGTAELHQMAHVYTVDGARHRDARVSKVVITTLLFSTDGDPVGTSKDTIEDDQVQAVYGATDGKTVFLSLRGQGFNT